MPATGGVAQGTHVHAGRRRDPSRVWVPVRDPSRTGTQMPSGSHTEY
jgi:hypothetical protein